MNRTRAIALCIMLISTSMVLANAPHALATTNGPRTADLIIYLYGNIESAYAALKAGTIDLISNAGYAHSVSTSGKLDGDGFLTSDLVYNAMADPNIVLKGVSACNSFQFDLNNNYTTKDAEYYMSPMSYREMRQAVAFLTDKDLIVNVFCGGFAERIDQMIPAPLKGCANTSYWYPNYPYEYNPLGAKAVLDSEFPEGSTPNPDYDAGFPGSAQRIRTYPAGHEKAGQDLDKLIFCVRNDSRTDTRREQAGDLITANMRRMGVPINEIKGTKSQLYDRVMGDFNYHLYTGSWDLSRFPSTTLYGLYHSSAYFPYGQNYVTGISWGNPKYPQLDALLAEGNNAIDYNTAVKATKIAAGYMTIECVNVPIWSDKSYCCWTKKLLGVTNMEGYGVTNPYTFMKAYKSDGTAIKAAQISAPNTVNSVYSNWWHDYNVLDMMTLYGGTDMPPYNLAADQTGFVRDWTVDTWDGGTKTKVSMTFRSDCFFCEPVSGNQKSNVDADTYFFNAWYDYQAGDGWFSNGFKDLDHIVKTGDYSFDIFFTSLSYWNVYYCQGPLRPIDVWSAHTELITKHTESFTEGSSCNTPGDIDLAEGAVWIEYVKNNSVALTPYTDYNIIQGKLHVYADIANGHTVEVKYWAVGDPKGYTPGNLAWQTIFEGAGMYYCTAFSEGVGGSVTFKRNPFYYMETPPIGEIDFIRKTNGAYKVDIYDLALIAGSFHYGAVNPDPKYFPGADIAPPGGVIDIFDAVTLVSIDWDRYWDYPE